MLIMISRPKFMIILDVEILTIEYKLAFEMREILTNKTSLSGTEHLELII